MCIYVFSANMGWLCNVYDFSTYLGWLSGLGYSYSQYSSTEFLVLVLVSSKVIVLVLVLVLVDKYSGTHTSTGKSTDILWYICDVRVKTI